MTPRAAFWIVAMALIGAGVGVGTSSAADPLATADLAPPQAHQVTVFGIVADPGRKTIDPKLSQIAEQLERLRPGHGFTLWGVKSDRLIPGTALSCPLRDGLEVKVTLAGLTDTGKVRLGVTLLQNGEAQFRTTVTTPPNQLFFCERPLPDGARLLIGIGAR